MRHARQEARKTPIHSGNRPGTTARPKPAAHAKDSYTKDSYARAIRRGVDKANKAIRRMPRNSQIENPALLAYWAPNRLRHTRATEVRKQFGLEAAQVILGHAKADVTQVYAERDTCPGSGGYEGNRVTSKQPGWGSSPLVGRGFVGTTAIHG